MTEATPEQIVAFLTGAQAMTQHVPADWYESLLRDSERLRAALTLAVVALDTAECVIDADGEVEAFYQVQTAHKAVKAALEPKP